MALSAEQGDRLADVLSQHADRLTNRWTEIVASSLRGRLSRAELARQVQELHRALVDAGRQGVSDLADEHGGELRAVLSELSTNRARQGFSATETAIS
ncbi:RsbRD N-terminal domain-containing protein, partial [Micromonospora sp. CPCC 205714]